MSTILVIDDVPELLRLNRAILSRSGSTIFTALNAHQAMQRLDEEHIDLAIIDVQMPDMDGFGLLSIIRSQQRYKNLPVIMLTATDADTYYDEIETYDIYAMMQKPISGRALVALVKDVLSGQPSQATH